MNVVFRADASINIGTGHIMRCLTLADALHGRGDHCHFVSRGCAGNLLDLVSSHGHSVYALSNEAGEVTEKHWIADARETSEIVEGVRADWLIVDHYRLGEEWERALRAPMRRLFAIDDVGRSHDCDLLLDQNFENPLHACYRESLGAGTPLLLGPAFALVRPTFAASRASALMRRDGSFKRLLVSMGGSDPENETHKVLAGILMSWKADWAVDVVIGSSNPHRHSIDEACRKLPNATLHVQTREMASLMAAADCAINACGSTTWERCCVGLPALVTVVSNDQIAIAESVAAAGAHVLLGRLADLSAEHYAVALKTLTPEDLRRMSTAAAAICDGMGAERVVDQLHRVSGQ